MTKTKSTKTIANLDELKIRLADIKLQVRSGLEKNTNAHKALKKEIAQILTAAKVNSDKSQATKNI